MASRAEQKAAARAARERAAAQVRGQQRRRSQLMMLAGVLAIAIAAVVVLIAVSSKGGGSATVTNSTPNTAVDAAYFSQNGAIADVKQLLDGIPETGNVLGNPSAPVTVTEYGDLVCPTCDVFALGAEKTLIADEVRTGKIKLAFRATETASGYANGSEFVNTQVAARAAGLQDKEWYYIMLLYDEQPHTIGGQDAELVGYVNGAYLQSRAEQIPKPFNLLGWEQNLSNSSLISDVHADETAASQLGVNTTPSIFVSGPKGTIQWAKGSSTLPAQAQTVSQIESVINQVS